jgi:hypothetical protein
MLLIEFMEPYPEGYADEQDDQTAVKISDVRKPRVKLTLGEINKLRRMLDIRRLEKHSKLKLTKQQYAVPSAQQPGMM